MIQKSLLIPVFKATHFGPTVLVTTISFILSLTQVSLFRSAIIATTIFCGQCTVGWTNDLIDQGRDTSAGRMNKPLVAGTVTSRRLQINVALYLSLAVILSYLGPLGVRGGSIHMLGLLSATIYNFGVKGTWFSFIPYALSFGAMPWAIYESVGKHPPVWLFVDFALMSIAFHFLNVIKDLEWDRTQSVLGLPQRIGKVGSSIAAGMCVLTSLIILFLR